MTPSVELAARVVMAAIAVSVFLAFLRLVRGPSLPDRVVALDAIGLSVVAMVACHSVQTGQPSLLLTVTALALISFLATTAFAYYVQRRGIQ